jgi:hypothetical protein
MRSIPKRRLYSLACVGTLFLSGCEQPAQDGVAGVQRAERTFGLLENHMMPRHVGEEVQDRLLVTGPPAPPQLVMHNGHKGSGNSRYA